MKKGTKMTIGILGIAGGAAWAVYGISGFFGNPFNFVDALVGRWEIVANTVYSAAGLAGAYLGYKAVA